MIRAHQLQFPLTDHVASLVIQVGVNRHIVGLAQQLIERDVLSAQLRLDLWCRPASVRIQDRHVEPQAPASHGLPDSTKANDPQYSPVDVGTKQKIRFPPLELSV